MVHKCEFSFAWPFVFVHLIKSSMDIIYSFVTSDLVYANANKKIITYNAQWSPSFFILLFVFFSGICFVDNFKGNGYTGEKNKMGKATTSKMSFSD